MGLHALLRCDSLSCQLGLDSALQIQSRATPLVRGDLMLESAEHYSSYLPSPVDEQSLSGRRCLRNRINCPNVACRTQNLMRAVDWTLGYSGIC